MELAKQKYPNLHPVMVLKSCAYYNLKLDELISIIYLMGVEHYVYV